MKQIIEIEIPEGFEAKYCPETSKIKLIKKDDKPKTWEEYCKNESVYDKFYISSTGSIIQIAASRKMSFLNKNICDSSEEAKAFLALMQLRLLRKAWVKDWVPNYTYNNYNNINWHIHFEKDKLIVGNTGILQRTLSFPSREMAEEFLNCFRNLIETAKPLL